MIEVRKTRLFEDWFVSLRDQQARLRVQVRIDRLAFGNPGQHRVLTGGVCEMKIDHGPGDVPPSLSSTAIWSPIPNDKEIGREEAFYRRTDHRLPA